MTADASGEEPAIRAAVEEQARRTAGDYLRIFGPAILLTLVGFAIAYQFVDPAPPKRIVIGTALEGGAYYAFGQRYREILGRNGVELKVRSTAGSVENLALLAAGEIDTALGQGGVRAPGGTRNLVSLGSLFFEPLWLFYRSESEVRRLTGLQGKRLAIGGEGSGTRAVALQLLEDNGSAQWQDTEFLDLDGNQAAQALEKDQVDAVFAVASPQSALVARLLRAPDVKLMSFERATAYTRRHRYLSRLILPQGVIDLAENLPAQNVVMLAPAANLVADDDLHPALGDLLLQAMSEVHGPGGLFEEANAFPSSQFLAFPLAQEARRFYASGPPFLQRYLPFWAATLADRLKVMLLPMVALLFPLIKVMPPVYRWRMRSRIYRWYKELRAIDPEVNRTLEPQRLNAYLSEMERLESEVTKVSVPLSYVDELYDLRLHIELVKRKLEALAKSQS